MLKVNHLKDGDYLLIGNTKEIYNIPIKDIYFIKSTDSHYVGIQTNKRNFVVGGIVSEIAELSSEFLLISQGLLVNLSNVRKIKATTISFIDFEIVVKKPTMDTLKNELELL